MTKIRSSILIALALTVVSSVDAYARPDVRTMTCAQAKYMVQANGAVVFTFTNNTYDRVVKNRRFCDRHEDASKSIIVKTKDKNRCNVGKKCVYDEPIFDRH